MCVYNVYMCMCEQMSAAEKNISSDDIRLCLDFCCEGEPFVSSNVTLYIIIETRPALNNIS